MSDTELVKEDTELVKKDTKLVKEYLSKKSRRMLKKIKFGGTLNLQIFVLTVALIAVLPLIQDSGGSFKIATAIPFLNFEYDYLITIYFLNLLGLLVFNIILGLVNINRKMRYKTILEEIRNI